MKYTFVILGLLIASTSFAQSVPNSFTAGQPAVADEVNANFSDLDARVNAASAAAALAITDIVVVESALVEDEGFAIANCPVGMTAISANCVCLGDGVTSNWGVLAFCAAGDDGTGVQGAAAACDIDFTYDPTLPFPQTGVSATCLGVTTASGATMEAVKKELAAEADYQASMGNVTSVLQLRKAAEDKRK